jgi:hypothetical protein
VSSSFLLPFPSSHPPFLLASIYRRDIDDPPTDSDQNEDEVEVVKMIDLVEDSSLKTAPASAQKKALASNRKTAPASAQKKAPVSHLKAPISTPKKAPASNRKLKTGLTQKTPPKRPRHPRPRHPRLSPWQQDPVVAFVPRSKSVGKNCSLASILLFFFTKVSHLLCSFLQYYAGKRGHFLVPHQQHPADTLSVAIITQPNNS